MACLTLCGCDGARGRRGAPRAWAPPLAECGDASGGAPTCAVLHDLVAGRTAPSCGLCAAHECGVGGGKGLPWQVPDQAVSSLLTVYMAGGMRQSQLSTGPARPPPCQCMPCPRLASAMPHRCLHSGLHQFTFTFIIASRQSSLHTSHAIKPHDCPRSRCQAPLSSSTFSCTMGAFLAKMLDQVMSSFKTEARILMVSAVWAVHACLPVPCA